MFGCRFRTLAVTLVSDFSNNNKSGCQWPSYTPVWRDGAELAPSNKANCCDVQADQTEAGQVAGISEKTVMAAPVLFLAGFTTPARCHLPCCLSNGVRGDAAFPASFSRLTSPRKGGGGQGVREREWVGVCEE